MSNTYKLQLGFAVPIILLLLLIIILLAVGVIPSSATRSLDGSNNPYKIVNLKRSVDRRDYVTKQMQNAGVTNYKFIEAVDGLTLELTEDLQKLFKGNDFGSKKGAIGCTLSHMNIYKKLLLDRDNDYYIVFEDDVYLPSNFLNNVSSMLKKAADYDLIFLGYIIWDEKLKKEYNPSSKKMVLRPLNRSGIFVGGTHGYYISKLGAALILDYISKNGAKIAIDHLIVQTPAELKVGECFPFIVDWDSKGLFQSNVRSHDPTAPKFNL